MPRKDQVRFGLKFKLIAISVLLTVSMTLVVSLSTYGAVSLQLSRELASKVQATVVLGAEAIDADRLSRLAARAALGPSPEETARLESTEDYRALSDQLNTIRDTDTRVIRYVYTFVPTDDPSTALFVVDADVLALLRGGSEGEAVDSEEISRIGTEFDVSEFDKAREALRDGIATIDDQYIYDPVYKVNSLSGYAPVRDAAGRTVAVLGIDMTDLNARAALSNVTRLSFIIAAGAILLGIGAATAMGIIMTRDVVALRRTVASFAEGDFSARSAIATRDEIGALARGFNEMVGTIIEYQEKLVSSERDKAAAELRSRVESARNAENRKYLDNISQGLLMIDGERKISAQYSASLVRLFRYSGDPSGSDFLDFVYPDAETGAAERAELSTFLDLLVGNTTADIDMIEELNPFKDKELRAYDGSRIFVDARFHRIGGAEGVETLMVVFDDKTGIHEAERRLDDQRGRYDAELEAIAAILKHGPLLFKDFVEGGESLVAELRAWLGGLGDSAARQRIMREFHSLKGTARSLDLAQIAKSAHRIEDLLLALSESGASSEAQAQIEAALSSVMEGIRDIRESVDRLSAFRAKGGPASEAQLEFEAYLGSLEGMAASLARELGKELSFETDVRVRELPFLKQLKNPIIHMVRNAIDHGLEDIYERTSLGKPTGGKLRLAIRKEGGELVIEVGDDGRGIDFERVRRKAVEKGLLPPGKEPTKKELLGALFEPGFSSKDETTEVSGRGVGLDVV
ncbi:MAG: Hpt domain-containing protein, partial [Spirochaetaceae bacterium]|nr:Hpt domain-containing protein [Spirochaetaceae bacterium]